MEKLLKVQNEIKAPKSQYNNFGKYKYRNCEDILEAVKPLLSKQQLSLIISDELVQLGNRFYVKATVKLYDKEKEITSVTSFAREEEVKKGMDCSQITGASSSYARKYALNGLFLIDDTKDSDTTNKGYEKVKKISYEEAKKLLKSQKDTADLQKQWEMIKQNKGSFATEDFADLKQITTQMVTQFKGEL